MNKEVISDKQGISIVVLFIMGSAITLPKVAKTGNDLWISVSIAVIATIIISFMYARIQLINKGNNLFDILNSIFGKVLGKIISMLYIWFSFHLGVIILKDLSDFYKTVSIPETPRIVPILMCTILLIYANKKGIEVIARLSVLGMIINILIPFIAILLLIPNMDKYTLYPLLNNGLNSVFMNAFSIAAFPFTLIIVLMMVFDCLKTKKSYINVYVVGVIISGVMLIGVTLGDILVIGPELYEETYYPAHFASSIISIGNFIQRLEVIVFITMTVAVFIPISLTLMAVCKGLGNLFEFSDHNFLIIPIALLMLNTAMFIHNSVLELEFFMKNIWPFYALTFEIIIPTIILIVSEIKYKKIKSAN